MNKKYCCDCAHSGTDSEYGSLCCYLYYFVSTPTKIEKRYCNINQLNISNKCPYFKLQKEGKFRLFSTTEQKHIKELDEL